MLVRVKTRHSGEFDLLGEPSVITSLTPFWGELFIKTDNSSSVGTIGE